ncbi:c-type cytochrome [Hyphococcus flavus]|uniref:C-type cytochrome n=1 Tax=Hyphococcus flavus TaxID=1866326 RepID=A0AAE9ZKL2_9PROT|nr:c-type cytochrome [Hyphococcus flavus]WDI32355.1 c-type cytochrome [Hyphococcus flavus]
MIRIKIIAVAVIVSIVTLGFGGVYVLSEARFRDVTLEAKFDHPISTDAASIEHGRHIARTRGCFGCHGQQLEGQDFGKQWDWPERAVAPNLAVYARDHDAATMEAAVRQGIGADGQALVSMPSFNFARLSDEDTAALIAFLKSAPVVESDLPKPELGWAVRWMFVTGNEKHMAWWADRVPPLRVNAEAEPRLARGEYMALTMCNECHGLDVRGFTLWEPYLPDLAMVAAISRQDFETLIKTGIGIGGRDLELMGLVAPDRFPELSDQEIDDLYAYLSSLINEPPAEGVFWRPDIQ